MWPFSKKKSAPVSAPTRRRRGQKSFNPLPEVLKPEDAAMLQCFTNCTVGGKIVLPSGYTIPQPPIGKVWHVNKTTITLRDANDHL